MFLACAVGSRKPCGGAEAGLQSGTRLQLGPDGRATEVGMEAVGAPRSARHHRSPGEVASAQCAARPAGAVPRGSWGYLVDQSGKRMQGKQGYACSGLGLLVRTTLLRDGRRSGRMPVGAHAAPDCMQLSGHTHSRCGTCTVGPPQRPHAFISDIQGRGCRVIA
eukprot:359715-Chlamydomonas_euryale.AAC.5